MSAGNQCLAYSNDESNYVKTLTASGVKVDSEGIKTFLKALHPNARQQIRASRLITSLGAEDGQAREKAMAQLIVMRPLPVELLQTAAKDGDLEIRWRAEKILQHGEAESDRLLFAVLMAIKDKEMTGVVDELFRIAHICDKRRLKDAFGQAIVAASRESDVPLLKAELKNQNVDVRVIVTKTLGKILERKAIAEFVELLNDGDDRVRFAAARILAEFGERTPLETLSDLLESEHIQVRSLSAMTLRGLTGKNYGFSAYATLDKRKLAMDKWRNWIAENGGTAKLINPLPVVSVGISNLNGNTLVAYGYKNKVVEFSPDWKEVWNYTVDGAYSAAKLNNGNYLIGCYASKQVIEVTPDKKVIWQLPVKSCINARPLPNGNILVAGHTSKEVFEVNRDKETVWTFKYNQNCYDAHRLGNGNTLVSTNTGILEVDPAGKTVWEYASGKQHYGIQPLPNGNLLIADMKEGAKEITREKKVVWQFAAPSTFDVQRLDNGNTVITTGNSFFEVTPDGKKLWTKSGNSYGRARR